MLTTKVQRIVLAFSVSVLAYGCTARDLYRVGQDYQREQCQRGPLSEYERCMKQANESYETYRRKKKEVEENP